jgi:hypothetical protein
MDGQYAPNFDLTDPGFDLTLLHDFRCRMLTLEAGQRFLDTFLPRGLQNAELGEGAWHTTDGFHACLGSAPHAAPCGMCPRSDALGPEPARYHHIVTTVSSIMLDMWTGILYSP